MKRQRRPRAPRTGEARQLIGRLDSRVGEAEAAESGRPGDRRNMPKKRTSKSRQTTEPTLAEVEGEILAFLEHCELHPRARAEQFKDEDERAREIAIAKSAQPPYPDYGAFDGMILVHLCKRWPNIDLADVRAALAELERKGKAYRTRGRIWTTEGEILRAVVTPKDGDGEHGDGGHPGRESVAEALPERKELPACVSRARAVYEWGLSVIPVSDDMTVQEIHAAILEKLDCTIAETPSGAGELEKLQELRDSLPDNGDTFGRYLRKAGIKRYNTRGDRIRKISHFRRRDEA